MKNYFMAYSRKLHLTFIGFASIAVAVTQNVIIISTSKTLLFHSERLHTTSVNVNKF